MKKYVQSEHADTLIRGRKHLSTRVEDRIVTWTVDAERKEIIPLNLIIFY